MLTAKLSYSNVSGISNGAWHHLVRTSNRGPLAKKIYLDGQLAYWSISVQVLSLDRSLNGHYESGQATFIITNRNGLAANKLLMG